MQMNACCQQDPFGNVKFQEVWRAGKSENTELLGSGETQLQENTPRKQSWSLPQKAAASCSAPITHIYCWATLDFAMSHYEKGKLHAPRGIVQGLCR